jgi:hypothetical protein
MLTRKTVKGNISSSEIKAAYQKAFRIAGEGWLQNLLRLFCDIRSVFNFADEFYNDPGRRPGRQRGL